MTRQRTVYLLYVDHPLRQGAVGHFHTITRVRCIFGKSAFCDKCLQPYDKRYGHRGCEQCVSCRGNQCTVVFDEKHDCPSCNRFMRSAECARRHKENGVCSSVHRCKDCGSYYTPSKEHRCTERECKICKRWVSGVHFCYIRQQAPKGVSCKYMFADFETDPTTEYHTPNLLVAHWQCEHCIDNSYRAINAAATAVQHAGNVHNMSLAIRPGVTPSETSA